MFVVEAWRADRDPFLRRVPGEIIFGEIRAVVRRALIVVDDDDLAAEVAAPEHFGRGRAGGARSNDYDFAQRGARRPLRIGRRERIALDFVAHEDGGAAPLDAPAGDGIERRRAQRLAISQAEAGVVPWT